MKTTFIKTSFWFALTGALVLTGLGSLPAVAQSASAVANDPHAISYSWGVIVTDDDGPQTSLLLNEKVAEEGARRVAALLWRPVSYEEYVRSLFTSSEFDTD